MKTNLLCCVVGSVIALSLNGVGYAQENPDRLPVRAVTLFSSGVSYTLREGEVNGEATVPLLFRTGQINDILKSLVLIDERGKVQPAVYNAKDPIGRALQSFAIDLTQPTDRASLLNRLKGASVTVKTKGTIAPGQSMPQETITGRIVGVEEKTEILPTNAGQAAGQRVTVSYLTLLTESGLQTVRLDWVASVQLLDERLNREFKDALSLLASGADEKRRQVTLKFSGDGKRRVRVGYVSESPLWKITYRLLISGTGDNDRPYLQGWALVENTTDDDWNGVRLSLVSGRPVSFIQDLYQPLYLPRPVVPSDVQASPYPQIAEAAIEQKPTHTYAASEGFPPGGAFGGGGGGSGGAGGAEYATDVAAPAPKTQAGVAVYANPVEMRSSVVAQAQGQKSGELFQYNITTPVTLPRQQAAMIPVVAQDVSGDKVSLYNADTDARFPLNAFRLKNNTPLHLKGGPVTIFDEGTYAGDARMEDIPPGDNRLITYAVDLSVEGERKGSGYSRTETRLIIERGVLIQTLRERIETEYTLKNKTDKPRTVLIEHPFNDELTLLSPEDYAERTPHQYRFEVKLPPTGKETLRVALERPIRSNVGLLNDALDTLQFWFERKETPQAIRD